MVAQWVSRRHTCPTMLWTCISRIANLLPRDFSQQSRIWSNHSLHTVHKLVISVATCKEDLQGTVSVRTMQLVQIVWLTLSFSLNQWCAAVQGHVYLAFLVSFRRCRWKRVCHTTRHSSCQYSLSFHLLHAISPAAVGYTPGWIACSDVWIISC